MRLLSGVRLLQACDLNGHRERTSEIPLEAQTRDRIVAGIVRGAIDIVGRPSAKETHYCGRRQLTSHIATDAGEGAIGIRATGVIFLTRLCATFDSSPWKFGQPVDLASLTR